MSQDILTLLDEAATTADRYNCAASISTERIRALVACVRAADAWFGLADNPDCDDLAVEADYHAARAQLEQTK